MLLPILLAAVLVPSSIVMAFTIIKQPTKTVKVSTLSTTTTTVLYLSSFAADGSEYSADKGSNNMDDDDDDMSSNWRNYNNKEDLLEDETPTIELTPVPISKNAGNRFIAVVWDRILNKNNEKDSLDLHDDRITLTEDHVMFCRKQNLYNETYNTNSMVDIPWSYQILSSDLQRIIGHIMCLESTELKHVQETLINDPIVQMLKTTNNYKDNDDIMKHIPLYRWRHIRDYTLRIDDGRDGYPCMCLALDYDAEDGNDDNPIKLREELSKEYLGTLIRSQRVIAAGPLHLPTIVKDDPSSLPIGDLILFNAKNRQDAIEFIENLPTSQAGLYKSLRVHFYNTLDVTGKFVSENPLMDNPCSDMKEAMEYWGYPVDDEQTPWLNW